MNKFNSSKIFFVINIARSGSTFLAGFLSGPNVIIKHEPPGYSMAKEGLRKYQGKKHKLKKLLASRLKWAMEAHKNNQFFGETSFYLLYCIDLLNEFFPNCKFIYITRHPYTWIKSGKHKGRNWYSKLDRYVKTRIAPRKDDPMYKNWGRLSQDEKIAWGWKEQNKIILKQFNALKLHSSRLIQLKLEQLELKNDNYQTFKNIYDFLNFQTLSMEHFNTYIREFNIQKTGAPPSFQEPQGSSAPANKWPFNIQVDSQKNLIENQHAVNHIVKSVALELKYDLA